MVSFEEKIFILIKFSLSIVSLYGSCIWCPLDSFIFGFFCSLLFLRFIHRVYCSSFTVTGVWDSLACTDCTFIHFIGDDVWAAFSHYKFHCYEHTCTHMLGHMCMYFSRFVTEQNCWVSDRTCITSTVPDNSRNFPEGGELIYTSASSL